jgi:transcriptional regulator of acetoin/glycerol metabolism
MEPLRLGPPPEGSWERFHREPRAQRDAQLAPWASRWLRARELGASPFGPSPEEYLIRGVSLLERREELDPMLVDGRGLFEIAVAAVSERDFTLLLSDATGLVTYVAGGGAFAPDARKLRLIEGACWSEASRGTNAIGTALAEDRPTMVLGGAHYGRRFHGLVCYAAPIHDPYGRLIGVLDATSHVGRADPAVGAVISAAALALEAVLRARQLAQAGEAARRLIERTLDRVEGLGMLVEPPGRIVRCNAAARVWLGSGPRETEAALGLSWEVLAREALSSTPGGRVVRALRLRVEPLLDAQGQLIQVALFGEPLAPPRPHPASPRPASPHTAPPEAPADDPFAPIFAQDEATRAAVDFARKVAPSELPVMLLSETGSGKELFAAAIHGASHRAAGPFVAINCGSIAPALLESELFGYAPAAFTGADRHGREGVLHAAAGGTLFLDEVAEMPPAMQVALLRVLEARVYRRVGESSTRPSDVRIICATCRELPELVASGAFRKDLYFRLKGVQISLPPLRRRTDRVELARHLLREHCGSEHSGPELGEELARFVARHTWPGNVRELKSVLAVACVLAGTEPTLSLQHLPPDLLAAEPAPEPLAGGQLAEVERRAVERALAEVGGNVSAAARKLGIARSTIYRMLKR